MRSLRRARRVVTAGLSVALVLTNASISSAAPLTIKKKSIDYTSPVTKDEASFTYPVIDGGAKASIGTLNARIAALADNEVNALRTEANATDRDPGVSYTLTGDFEVIRNDNRFLSLEFSIGDFFGGVHPNSHTVTMNYDVASGKIIKLQDLF